jgi:N-acetylglucosamine malate deacetylase 1
MRTLVIAPHPNDELLGCGGTILRRVAEGASVGWMILTDMRALPGVAPSRLQGREDEVEHVRAGLGLPPERVFKLALPTTSLDTVGLSTLVERFSAVFRDFQPEEVLTPHFGDVHSDHRVAFDAVVACTKWRQCGGP